MAPRAAGRGDPLDREIARLAVPALGALAAEPLYLLADTAVVGHLGTPQLGGLAVAGTVLTTAFWLFNFLVYGTTAAVSRALGAGHPDAAARHAAQALWLALGLGVALAGAGLVGAPVAVDLMGANPAVRPHALTYLRISAVGAPAVLVGLVGVGYLRGLQDTITPLRILVLANLANLAVEVALIYGAGLGLGASAASTVAAQVGAAVVFTRWIVRHVRSAGVAWRPDWSSQRHLLTVGRDLFIRTGSLLLALALATAVASRLGTAEVAAHQVAFGLWSFLALVLDALAVAAQAMVGRLLGAGGAGEARAVAQRLLRWGVLAGVAFAAAVALARPFLPGLFTDDPRVEELAASVLWMVALLQPLNAVVFVLDGVLIGAGDLRFLARAMLAALAVYAPLAVAVGALDLTLTTLWGAVAVLMVARLVAMVSRFASSAWAVTGPGPSPGGA